MPRPNKPSSLEEEDNLASRICYEREQRGWSYEGLAKRMSDAGNPIQPSALYKVEKGSPRRRITVAELVALGKVFETNIQDLLISGEVLRAEVTIEQWRAVKETAAELELAQQAHTEAWERLAETVRMVAPDNRNMVLKLVLDKYPHMTDWASEAFGAEKNTGRKTSRGQRRKKT